MREYCCPSGGGVVEVLKNDWVFVVPEDKKEPEKYDRNYQ